MTAETEGPRRTPPLIAGCFTLIIVLLFVSIGLQAGVINPTTQSNHDALSSQGAEIKAVACAIAESSANAARVRSEDPETGRLETLEHFHARMLAQRHTLLAASGIGCHAAKGFPPFGQQVREALREIRSILAPLRHRTASASPSKQGGPLAAAEGGDATSTGNPGSSQPGPHGGGGGHEPGTGGSHGAPAPGKGGSDGGPAPGQPGSTPAPAPTSEGSTSTSSSSTTERTSESTVVEKQPEASGDPVGSLTESVGHVVEEAGSTANGAVEGVQETTCSLAAVLCK